MAKINIYCNYGVLAKEKLNVYTYGAEHETATCSVQQPTTKVVGLWS